MPCDCTGMDPINDLQIFLNQILLDNDQQKSIEKTLIVCKENLIKELCQRCKFLTAPTMQSIYRGYPEDNLLNWYLDHLIDDYRYNFDDINSEEKDLAVKELRRLGYEVVKPYAEHKFFEFKKMENK